MKLFLQNEAHSRLIAQIALLFQGTVTVLITLCLLIFILTAKNTESFLALFFAADVIFVMMHLTYRKAYRGKKIILGKSEKLLLFTHVVTALLALYYTYYILIEGLTASSATRLWFVLSLWVISVLFGYVFYVKKYIRGSLSNEANIVRIKTG